jgi:hypothetical protein
MERPKKRGRAWTSEDDADLRTRIDARQQVAVIARETGRTLEAIRGRAATLRLTLPSPLRPWRVWKHGSIR